MDGDWIPAFAGMTVRGCVTPGLLAIPARAGLRRQDASAKIRIENVPNGEPFGQRDIPIFHPPASNQDGSQPSLG